MDEPEGPGGGSEVAEGTGALRARLAESEELYRAVVTQTSDGIFVFDPETLRVLEWNRAFAGFLGFPEGEHPTVSLYDIVGHDRADIEENARRAVEKGEHRLGERAYRARDGRELIVDVTANRILFGGRTAVCVVTRDITGRRHQEKELARRNELLHALADISARLASASDPDGLLRTLGEELATIGCHCIVGTFRPPDRDLWLRFVCEHGVHEALRSAGYAGPLEGLRIDPACLDVLARVVATLEAAVLTDARPLFRLALPELGREGVRTLFSRLGITARTGGALLPLVANEEPIGAMLVWGDRFHPDDLPAASVFASLVAHVLERARLLSELARQAVTDPLTGLLNRRGFTEQAVREVERALRFGRPLSLLMVDADGFKPVNDRFGHLAGDAVLVALARRLKTRIRGLDIAGRIGGDEIAVVLPETTLDTARTIAERLRVAVSGEPFDASGESVRLSVSIGTVALASPLEGLGDLLRRADAALYEAKAAGRNAVVVR